MKHSMLHWSDVVRCIVFLGFTSLSLPRVGWTLWNVWHTNETFVWIDSGNNSHILYIFATWPHWARVPCVLWLVHHREKLHYYTVRGSHQTDLHLFKLNSTRQTLRSLNLDPQHSFSTNIGSSASLPRACSSSLKIQKPLLNTTLSLVDIPPSSLCR